MREGKQGLWGRKMLSLPPLAVTGSHVLRLFPVTLVSTCFTPASQTRGAEARGHVALWLGQLQSRGSPQVGCPEPGGGEGPRGRDCCWGCAHCLHSPSSACQDGARTSADD